MAKKASTHVLSVRFPEDDLRRLQALAAIVGSTPNAIVLDAVRRHIPQVVASPEYARAKDELARRAEENRRLLEGDSGSRLAQELASASKR